MCGRYTLTLPLPQVADELGLDLPDFDMEPRYNVAPTQTMPVFTAEEPLHLQRMRWGLIPFWAKDPSIGNKLLNARAETLAEKPAFRNALKHRRCLVPVDGFYEWKKTDNGKLPHHIRLKTCGLITFAGLWETWNDAEGRELRTFTIITTSPNDLMADIHDRMPVIIAPENRRKWLNPQTSPQDIQALLVPYPDGELETLEISTLVNSPRNEGPRLLQPAQRLF